MQRKIPEFAALRRRWRLLMSELSIVERQVEADRDQRASGNYTLSYKEEIEQELNELDFVFAYFNRVRNGYHLSTSQALTLAAFTALSVLAGLLLARGG